MALFLWWGPLVGGVGVVLGWVGPVGCPWWGHLVLVTSYVAVCHARGAPPPLREGVSWCFLLIHWRWPVGPSVSKKIKNLWAYQNAIDYVGVDMQLQEHRENGDGKISSYSMDSMCCT